MKRKLLSAVIAIVFAVSSAAAVRAESYHDYKLRYADKSENGGEYAVGSGLPFTFSEEEQSAQFLIQVERGGAYNIELVYRPYTNETRTSPNISVAVNGEVPFSEADFIELGWRWSQGTPDKDSRGNEILPDIKLIDDSVASVLSDPSGRENKPLYFYFENGLNTISVTVHSGQLVLEEIRIKGENKAPEYKEYKSRYSDKKDVSKDKSIRLEAERCDETSDSTLTPDYDKGDANTSPNDAATLLYNMISGDKYNSSGQWLKWYYTPEESGIYNISLRIRQNDKNGFTVIRKLLIDGETLFDELNNIEFSYSSKWYVKTLGEDEPYRFYFEAGKKYEIALEVATGSLADITVEVDNLVYQLNSLYRSIIMVAGTNADAYRDYQLDTAIPGFVDTVKELRKSLEDIVNDLKAQNSGRLGSQLTAMLSLINRLKQAEKDPDLLAKNSSALRSDVQSLSAWNQDAKAQPLDIDYIEIHSPAFDAGKAERGAGNFFKSLIYNIRRLLYAFDKDYGTVGDINPESESVNVWISTGREQLSIFKKLADNDFSVKSGINVKASLVTTDIRNAVLAGTAPDAAIFLSSDMPVNMALRGAVADLSGFDGFDEAVKRFDSACLVPFYHNNGCYALPVTQTFDMMFVRTDVFDELGLAVPQTWEDFYEVSTVLQRNNLDVGIPSTIGMFATLLFQYGGEFFNDDFTASGFDSSAANNAFNMWTGLFSKYGFPISFDFYNRFSSGEMPLGISDYTQYLKLKSASPEISDRWIMTLIPGIKDENGEINRTVSCSAATGGTTNPGLAQSVSSAVIFSDSEKKDAAWQLLEWFTSDEVQTKYGYEIESALGMISRYTPANKTAFNNMPWTRTERELLISQRSFVKGIPEVSGNYSVTRELTNAFRQVVYENTNPTDTLHRYNVKINKELERKNANGNG